MASEVKSLAGQTADATEEITTQVNGIQQATEATVSSIGGISKTIRQINEVSSVIATAIEEQGIATQEINQTISKANTEVELLSKNSTEVAEISDANDKAATDMSDASEQLKSRVDSLKSAAQDFVAAIVN